MREKGINAAHYDAVYVKPLDQELLHRAFRKGVPVVTVEDAAASGGFGSAVAEWSAANGYGNSLEIIGIPDRFIAQGTVPELQRLAGIDAEGIQNRILQLLKSNQPETARP